MLSGHHVKTQAQRFMGLPKNKRDKHSFDKFVKSYRITMMLIYLWLKLRKRTRKSNFYF